MKEFPRETTEVVSGGFLEGIYDEIPQATLAKISQRIVGICRNPWRSSWKSPQGIPEETYEGFLLEILEEIPVRIAEAVTGGISGKRT